MSGTGWTYGDGTMPGSERGGEDEATGRLSRIGEVAAAVRTRVVVAHVANGERLAVGDSGHDRYFWLILNTYRVVTLLYAVVLYARVADEYLHPLGAWCVLAVMGLWTVTLLRWRRRDELVMIIDLVIATWAVLMTRVLDDPVRIAEGSQTLPTIWVSTTVLSWAVWRGWLAGLLAALVIAAADVIEVDGRMSGNTTNNIVMMILAGVVVGYNMTIFLAGRRDLARAAAIEAAARERERLAADIHDSVLQVLAYVRRRGHEAGGEAAEIAELAGEQEARLRSLIATGPGTTSTDGEQDLRALLTALSRGRITVTGPAGSVMLPGDVATAVVGAVGAALDNVARHAGPSARAWVFIEDEGGVVTVTVRDDGIGIPAGRLAEAESEGRLGVPMSIRARVENVGGSVEVTSRPGEGTEVELRVPRAGRRRTQ